MPYRRLTITLLVSSCSAVAGCSAITTAECRLLRLGDVAPLSIAAVYPNRHSQRRHIADDLYADLKYSSFTSEVRVMLVRMPHAPWSFGESVVSQDIVRLVPEDDRQIGSITLDEVQSGAQLVCETTH